MRQSCPSSVILSTHTSCGKRLISLYGLNYNPWLIDNLLSVEIDVSIDCLAREIGLITANPLTFNAGGSWTYVNGGGRWVQVEGMYFFNFTNAAGLVYAANVTTDTVFGILSYSVAGANPGSGVWWGTRPGAACCSGSGRNARARHSDQSR